MNTKNATTTKKTWLESEERKKLIEAANRAGKIFERVIKEREDYELRELARKIRAI